MASEWPCSQCTFANPNSRNTCGLCKTSRFEESDRLLAQKMQQALNTNHLNVPIPNTTRNHSMSIDTPPTRLHSSNTRKPSNNIPPAVNNTYTTHTPSISNIQTKPHKPNKPKRIHSPNVKFDNDLYLRTHNNNKKQERNRKKKPKPIYNHNNNENDCSSDSDNDIIHKVQIKRKKKSTMKRNSFIPSIPPLPDMNMNSNSSNNNMNSIKRSNTKPNKRVKKRKKRKKQSMDDINEFIVSDNELTNEIKSNQLNKTNKSNKKEKQVVGSDEGLNEEKKENVKKRPKAAELGLDDPANVMKYAMNILTEQKFLMHLHAGVPGPFIDSFNDSVDKFIELRKILHTVHEKGGSGRAYTEAENAVFIEHHLLTGKIKASSPDARKLQMKLIKVGSKVRSIGGIIKHYPNVIDKYKQQQQTKLNKNDKLNEKIIEALHDKKKNIGHVLDMIPDAAVPDEKDGIPHGVLSKWNKVDPNGVHEWRTDANKINKNIMKDNESGSDLGVNDSDDDDDDDDDDDESDSDDKMS